MCAGSITAEPVSLLPGSEDRFQDIRDHSLESLRRIDDPETMGLHHSEIIISDRIQKFWGFENIDSPTVVGPEQRCLGSNIQ